MRTLRFTLAVLALGSAAACTSVLGLRDDYAVRAKAEASVEEDGGDAGTVEDDPRVIEGSVTVHAPGPEPNTRVFVVIGRLAKVPPKEIDDKGSITIVDEAIYGAQDVTLIRRVNDGTSVSYDVTTIVGVNRRDVWFGRWQPPQVRAGVAAGRVVGAGDTSAVWLTTDRADFRATNLHPNPGGAFTTDLTGPGGGPFRMVAWRSTAPPVVLAAGASPPLYVSDPAVGDAGDISLDHALTETLSLRAIGADFYDDDVEADLSFLPEKPPGPVAFTRPTVPSTADAGNGDPMFTAQSIAMTAPFDTGSRFWHLRTSPSRADTLPSAQAWGPFNITIGALQLPKPATIVRPSTGTASVPHNALVVEYDSGQSSIMAMALTGTPANAHIKSFTWTMLGEGTKTGKFIPFALPSDVVEGGAVPAGEFKVAVETVTFDMASPGVLGSAPGVTSTRQLVRQAVFGAKFASTGYRPITLTP